jgi:hypothetical protein
MARHVASVESARRTLQPQKPLAKPSPNAFRRFPVGNPIAQMVSDRCPACGPIGSDMLTSHPRPTIRRPSPPDPVLDETSRGVREDSFFSTA